MYQKHSATKAANLNNSLTADLIADLIAAGKNENTLLDLARSTSDPVKRSSILEDVAKVRANRLSIADQGLDLFRKANNATSATPGSSKLGTAGKIGGAALNTIDLAGNGYLLADAVINSDGSGMANREVGKASADVLGSAVSMTPGIGQVYAGGDLVSTLLTGKGINDNIDEVSMGIFEGEFNYKYNTMIREDREEWMQHLKDIGQYDTYLKVVNKQRMRNKTIKNPCSPKKGNYKNPDPNDPTNKATVSFPSSLDPNEMIGPEGQPDKRWVSVNDRLPYTVLFENHELATAPAQYIRITVPAHEKMDAGTFQLSSVGFNDFTFVIPDNPIATYQRLDVRDSLGLFVDLNAGYDVVNNQFFWEFQSIDPVTLMPPDNPMRGLLLLQDTLTEGSMNGHGLVDFTIKPKPDAVTLDSILAKADIIFDVNDTIPTNIEKNVIDAFPPTSQMGSLAPEYEGSIPLSWAGQDDPGGSGVHYYTLYYSTDGENFSILQDKMTQTDTVFTGPGDQTYYFFVLATDTVGNHEKMDVGNIQSTYLRTPHSPVPVSWLYFQGKNRGNDNLLEWATANERNTKEFRVERSSDAKTFMVIGSVKSAGNTSGNTSYSYMDYDIDKLGVRDTYYRLTQIDNDGGESYSNVVRLKYEGVRVNKTIVYPNPTKGIITVATTHQALIGTEAGVYDEAGKLLQSVKITSASQQFNLERYTNGIYFIKLENGEVMKIMKH